MQATMAKLAEPIALAPGGLPNINRAASAAQPPVLSSIPPPIRGGKSFGFLTGGRDGFTVLPPATIRYPSGIGCPALRFSFPSLGKETRNEGDAEVNLNAFVGKIDVWQAPARGDARPTGVRLHYGAGRFLVTAW